MCVFLSPSHILLFPFATDVFRRASYCVLFWLKTVSYRIDKRARSPRKAREKPGESSWKACKKAAESPWKARGKPAELESLWKASGKPAVVRCLKTAVFLARRAFVRAKASRKPADVPAFPRALFRVGPLGSHFFFAVYLFF
jgi:hypothetical protein